MTYRCVSKKRFSSLSFSLSLLVILREKRFFPVHATGRSSAINQAHFSVGYSSSLKQYAANLRERAMKRITTLRSTSGTANRTKRPSRNGRMYVSAAIERRWFSQWNTSDRTRREGAYSEVWFFNARAIARADAFVCKVRSRIFRSCSAATAAWRHRREICIYQAGATNISFIICSERLICSPRRAASTCPPPPPPPPGEPPSSPRATALSSFTLSVRVEPRHAPFYPSRARRLKLIPNNACKSLGKCTSRVKTAPPSAGNGGHSIFVQRCFRRWRGHAVAKVRVVRARVNYPGLSGRIISSTTSRFCNARIVSTRWMFGFFFFFAVEWFYI